MRKNYYNVRQERGEHHKGKYNIYCNGKGVLECGDHTMDTGDIEKWIYGSYDENKLIPDLSEDIDADTYKAARAKIVADIMDDFLTGSGIIEGLSYNLLLRNEYKVNIKTSDNPDVWDADAIPNYVLGVDKEEALENAKDYLKDKLMDEYGLEVDTDAVDDWQYQIKKITSSDEDDWETF